MAWNSEFASPRCKRSRALTYSAVLRRIPYWESKENRADIARRAARVKNEFKIDITKSYVLNSGGCSLNHVN
jgi:hypothetical protein